VRPDLILLDLNLPRRDGLEVLKEVKADPDLRSITVVVLTTSEAPADVNSAYDLNANCYVVKPVDLEAFTVAIRGIEHFWMAMASLPTRTPSGAGQGDRADSATGGPSAKTNGPALFPRRLRPASRSRAIRSADGKRHRRRQ
jgi:DNA-binding LytR/AlgR family response regulator